eukprot:2214975-Pleurochrysis_carterae.AAC.2
MAEACATPLCPFSPIGRPFALLPRVFAGGGAEAQAGGGGGAAEATQACLGAQAEHSAQSVTTQQARGQRSAGAPQLARWQPEECWEEGRVFEATLPSSCEGCAEHALLRNARFLG